MEEYRHGSHSLFRIHVHVAWITKYRKEVLRGEIGLRFRDLARQICSDMGVLVLSGVVAKEHVHMLLSIPPQVSVSKVLQKVKGKTSYKLQREFGALRKQYWGQRMWGRGYFACSTGNVSDQMIKEYIEGHVDKDDNFHVGDE